MTPLKLKELSVQQYEQKDFVGAKHSLQQLIESNPKDSLLWSNLSYISYLLSDYANGEEQARQAISHDDLSSAPYTNLVLNLNAQGKYLESLKMLEHVIEIHPAQADLWVNKGVTLQALLRIPEALLAYQKAISLDDASAHAWCNLALCYQEVGQVEKAWRLYNTAFLRNPELPATVANRMVCAQYHPSLASAEIKRYAIESGDSITKISVSQVSVARHENPIETKLPTKADLTDLKIGFIGADFYAHPVGWFFRDVFKLLCQRHQCSLLLNQSKNDDVTKEFLAVAHSARWITGYNSAQVQEQISELKLDVLIDLSGHTAGNRLDVLATRAAPLQLSWLGFPASTGVSNVDAVLLSKDLITPASSEYFTEVIETLNAPQFVYRPPSYLPSVSQAPCLDKGHLTFGCFNNIAKINDDVVVCWAQLLLALPNSRLILKWKTLADASVRDIILKRFHSLGIHSNRLDLRAATDHTTMLNEYADVDVCLDPFPFSGALTSFEAAWMGVPTVSMTTHRAISRQTLSLNRSIGLDDWCVETSQDYVSTVISKTADHQALNQLRHCMRGKLGQASTSNASAMTDELERCLISLHKARAS